VRASLGCQSSSRELACSPNDQCVSLTRYEAYKRARDSEDCLTYRMKGCDVKRPGFHMLRNAGTATTPQSCTSACQDWRLKACALATTSQSTAVPGAAVYCMHCNVLLQLPLAGENALPTGMAWHGVYARYRHAYRLAWPAKLQHRITEVPLASNARKYAGQGVVAGTVAVLAVPDSTG
jgi:hypothetical protein